jgi:hypothetical protein
MYYSIASFANTAVGWGAGQQMLCAASYNSSLGYYAMTNAHSGCWNTAIGAYSMCANTYGKYNTAVGYEALLKTGTSTGGKNTAIGVKAGRCTCGSLGIENVYIGHEAGSRNTCGSCNIAIGSCAQNNITGTYKGTIAIGERSCATAHYMAVFGGINTNCVKLKGAVDFRICLLAALP